MADRSRGSDLEDPLQVYNGLWLLPRTLKSLTNSLPPPCPDQSDNLQHTHGLLEAMPLKIQSEHLEQAKVILDSSSEHSNSEIPATVVSEDANKGTEMNPIANLRERRPGLGRKRARFSLKPTASQPTPSFEPSFDITQYQNPEDFFSAYEKFENAKREWQKQTGTSLADAKQDQPSTRPRRPGISGRKRVSYNHRYSTDAITLEASSEEMLSPSKHISLKESTIAHDTTVDGELADTIVDAEKKVDDILGELLACTQDELDGDGVVNLLEERLHIKPPDVEKLSLPEQLDVRKIDLKASRRNLSKSRTVLSDIGNMLKGICSETASKNTRTASLLQSPLASVSSLKDNILPPNPQKDQFSFPDSNHLLTDVSFRSLSQQSNEVDATKDLNICSRSSTSNDLDNGVGDSMDDGIAHRNSSRPELNVDMQAEGNDGGVSISDTNRNVSRSETDPDIHAVELNQSDTLMEDTDRGATRMEDSTVEKDGIPTRLDESSRSPKGTQEQHNEVNGSSESAGNLQEQHNELNEGTKSADELQEQNAEELHNPSQEQVNEQSQKLSRNNKRNKPSKTLSSENKGNKRTKTLSRENKAFSRRKSLAAAGSNWESGTRRSTRIKSRPLEYWKGERFLYGRIHESLATVIGIKYESPGKGENEKPALKVKSFVSDEYKELVDLAARH